MRIDPAASGPDTHLDPDRMADLFDGLLAPDAAEAARGHLASCAQCADDFALITMDSGLAGVLTPEPIPMDVAIRVEAALHREPPLSGASTGSAGSAASAASQQSVAPRRSRRFRLVFGSLAGASLVIAGAVAGITALNSSADSKSSVSTAAGNDTSSRDSLHGDSTNSKAAGAAPDVTGPSSVPALAPDSPQSVESQAEQLLRKSGQTPQAANGSGESKAQSERFQCPPDGLQNVAPLGMTAITYQGQPAELLAYPKPGDPLTAAVYVVATTGCTASAPGHVLYSTEVPRP